MTRDVEQARRAIRYLNEQMEQTSLAEMRRVFGGMIEEQTKIVMLAQVSPEYVFRTVDPAVAPERKFRPNRVMITVVGLVSGAFLGILVVLVKQYMAGRGNFGE